MRKEWWSRLGLAAVLGGLTMGAGASVGCAKQAEPISQVQVNYTRKSDLLGTDKNNPTEWYMRMTVTDVRRSNHFAFPGYQDELRRVVWDVQENFLIARRSYELVSGSDGKGADPKVTNGVVTAMYRIESHFDVQRAYNPNSGEEQNILVENSSDRPWYDREFMRVDWTKNLVTDADFQGFWIGEIFGDIQWQPSAYFETDPNSPNAPVLDTANGYMDVTAKWYAKTENLFGIKGLPYCAILNWYSGSDVRECNDEEISVRTSFMKVGNRDYEAMETNSEKFSMFGTFNRDRYGFDKAYEINDKHWHRLIARHNVWGKSHDARACFAKGGSKLDADATCASVPGSTCDAYAGKCTIPLKDRPVKTIAYHVSSKMPADLWDTNVQLISDWNRAMMDAIAAGREVECRQIGGDKDSCHGQFFDGDVAKESQGPALVLCHNPVITGDHKSCGVAGTSAREGDLRFNLLGWVDQALTMSPLGYGPDGADPLTGEVVQATAYIYGAPLDNYAGMARDLVLVANGNLKADDFALGKHVPGNLGQYDPKKAALYADVFKTYSDYLAGRLDQNNKPMSLAELKGRIEGIQPAEFVAHLGAAKMSEGASAAERLGAVQSHIANKGVNGDIGFGGKLEAESRFAGLKTKLAGGKTEQALIGNQDFMSANAMGDIDMGNPAAVAAAQKAASPFGGLSILELDSMHDKIAGHMEHSGVCMFGMNEFTAPHIEGLARRLKDKFKDMTAEERSKAIFAEIRKAIYKGVTEHEVGHTVALRHNFQGSWDSLNFHPNYWKLRTANGTKTAECTGPRTDVKVDTCMGPRYLDPESPEESGLGATPHAGIEEFAYSSIMDYGYDFNTDLHGIGSYDKAAMKFIYGGVVEVFPAGNANATKVAPLLASPGKTTQGVNVEGPMGEQWMVKRTDKVVGGGDVVQPTHYTTLARIMGKDLFDPERCHDALPHEEGSAIDGKVCKPMVKEHAGINELVTGKLDGVDPAISATMWKTKDGRIRWPYRFATDEYASNSHILRFDAGADIYESAANVGKLYEYRYVLDYWRRGRRGFFPYFTMFYRQWDRYFRRVHTYGWTSTAKVAQYAAMYPDKNVTDNPALKSDDWGRGYTIALTSMFETLEHAAFRPQPGFYNKKASEAGQLLDLYEVPDNDDAPKTNPSIGVLEGRWIDDDLNNTIGGSFHYHEFLDRFGVHVEKPLATITAAIMFPPQHTYSRDTYLDGRNMLLNFRSVMPVAYDRFLGGILASDTDLVAPWIDRASKKDAGGNFAVKYPKLWEKQYIREGANVMAIDPLVGYRFQVPTVIWSMIFGSEDGGLGITNKMRVWIEGGPEAITLPDSEKAFFYEPDSGVTWAARKYGTETVNSITRPTGIGERMLLKANALMTAAYKVETKDGLPVYDDVTHRPKWEVGAKENEVRDAAAMVTFRRYVGLLNVTRNAMVELGFGPSSW